MKTAIKTMMIGVAACAFAAPAFAYTINGVIPPAAPPKPVVIHLHQPIPPNGKFLFRFFAPKVNAGVAYSLDFCIGPAFNPCGLPTSTDVTVPAGQQRLLTIDTSVFAHNILVVGQGTKKPVPYSVTVEYIP
jgi:hypothetical protein